MRDISLEIANRTARTVMLERFELIRNNPRLVEDISILVQTIQENRT